MIKGAVFILVVIVVLAGIFLIFKPKNAQNSSNPAQNSSKKEAPVKKFDFKFEKGEVVSKPESAQVNQGDSVVISVMSDVDEELHLHGYEKEVEIEAGETGEISLTATISGRFPIELHDSDMEIGSLEVLPY